MSLSRRTLLKGAGLLLASTALPIISFRQALAQDLPTGGRLIVAADSEPRNLNPAIVASNDYTIPKSTNGADHVRRCRR